MGDVIAFPAQDRPDDSTPEPLWREAVGHELREERHQQQRTLADVAEESGVSVQYLSEVERGRKEPSSELLNAICDALRVPLSQVLIDAGERMAGEERVTRSAASRANIDVSTKVVIPPVASLAVA